MAPKNADQDKWDIDTLKAWLKTTFGIEWAIPLDEINGRENLEDRLKEVTHHALNSRSTELGPENFKELERSVFLTVLDGVWVEHLTYLEQLRKGIFLRAYGQNYPLIEFKK